MKHNEDSDDEYISRLRKLIYERGLDVIRNKVLNVILIKDECIQKTVKRQPIIIRYVDIGLCNNCGICYSQFLCPAIEEKVKSAYIDSKLCLGCGICEEICPNKAIKTEELL